MDERANELIRLHEQMASRRGIWEGHWREVAERVRPTQNLFQQERPDGDKRNERIFDATAPLALPKFAAAVISFTMPHTQKYQSLTTGDEELDDNPEVKRYLEAVNDAVFKARYAAQANFISQSSEVILDDGAFGTGILFIDDALGKGIRYKSLPLAECYVSEDEHGSINRLHRKFQFTAEQAAKKFGTDKLSEGIRRALEKDPLCKFWFLHCVGPNEDYDASRRDHRGMDFSSCYIEFETRSTVEEGGFRRFPFAVPRFETSPREVYGRSPAMAVLPDIKMLNEMSKTVLRAGQMVVAPPIMLTEDASLAAFNVRSNALNYGYVDTQGRAMAIPFQTQGRVDIGLDMMNQRREAINDAFFVTLFRILVEEPTITATEAMLRAQEKGQLLGPPMGRIQSEMLGPTTEREIDILAASGALPPMPQVLRDRGRNVNVKYQGPLNQAQRAGVGVGILNTIQAVAPLAQIDPGVMLRFDIDGMAQELAEINLVPARFIRSDDEVAALKGQQEQAAQVQQLLAAAPVAASAAKDFAQAQATAGTNQVAPAVIPEGA
ncbi:phage head-tail adapter protein [Cupriavidus necator]|uniref:portal protein n=1 Tax=Cupriavidus necator TaxID=106590 RepID=UPI00148FC152|nr:portal protein [Cupriavidus necator]NOV24168.1 phage head-tail adapter protein [Cupriavidus necator]